MSVATAVSPAVFLLPDLGEGLTEAEVVEWHVAVGDDVVVDQTVVEVETAKAMVDVPCPYAGRVVTGCTASRARCWPSGRRCDGRDRRSAGPADSAGAGARAGRRRRRARCPGAVPRGGAGRVRQRAHRVRHRETSRTRRRRVGALPRRRPPRRLARRRPLPHPALPHDAPAAHAPAPRAVQVISPLVRRLAREPRHRPGRPARHRRRMGSCAAATSRRRSPAAPGATAAGPAPPPPAPARVAAAGRRSRTAAAGRPARRTCASRCAASAGRRRQADPQPARDPRRDHLGRRRRHRAAGGPGRDPNARDPDAGSACWRCWPGSSWRGLRRFPELNARVDTEASEIVQLGRGSTSGFAAQTDARARRARGPRRPAD